MYIQRVSHTKYHIWCNLFGVVTEEPVEFERLVEVQDFRKLSHHFRGIHKILIPQISREKPKDHNM